MSVYTYIGNLDPSERTTALVLRGGALILRLGRSADLTTDEYDELFERYNLVPGSIPPPVPPSASGNITTDGVGHIYGPDGTLLIAVSEPGDPLAGDSLVATDASGKITDGPATASVVTVASGTPTAGQVAVFTGTGNQTTPGAGSGGRLSLPPYFGQTSIASRGNAYGQGGAAVSSGGQTNRYTHRIIANAQWISVLYGNFLHGGIAPLSAAPITVQAGFWTAPGSVGGGTYFPLTFGGAPSRVIAPGAMIATDPIGIEVVKGTFVQTDTFIVPTNNGQICPSDQAFQNDGSFVDGYAAGNELGAAWSAFTQTFVYGYSPMAILAGFVNDDVCYVACIGDSIMDGQGDLGTPDVYGWLLRAFGDNVPVSWQAVPGDAANGWIAGNNGEIVRQLMTQGCTHAVEAFGANDLGNNNPSQLIADRQAIWNLLAEVGVQNIYAATINPTPSSTDGFMTEANQTPGAHDAERVTVNTYIRTVPAPLKGIIDFAASQERILNSGISRVRNLTNTADITGSGVGYPTSTGVHPAERGHDLGAQGVDLSKFKGPRGTQPPAYVPQNYTDPYSAAVLATGGIVSFWKLSEASGTTAADSGPGGNPGTYTGGITLGQSGQDSYTSALFDGTSGTVLVPTAGDLAPGTTFSWEAWVYPTDLTHEGSIITDSSNPRLLMLPNAGGQPDAIVGVNVTGGSMTANAWHHLVFTNSGITGILYVDGTQVATGTTAGLGLNIGTVTIGSQGSSDFFKGRLQFVALYNQALSSGTVAAHFAAI